MPSLGEDQQDALEGKESTMLVFSRRQNETITIGGLVEVTLLKCGRGQAKIGIKAPQAVSVHRKETVEAIDQASCLVEADEFAEFAAVPKL
jgi:carbon storage regulator